MDTGEFLGFVITAQQGGWLPICASNPTSTEWKQYWRAWPDDAASTVELINGLVDDHMNVYYCAHLFTEQSTQRQYVMPTRTIFCDLDRANVGTLSMPTSLTAKSSDESHQGYWRMNEWLDPDETEQISKRVTYGIKDADHSGWPLGHMMRVPNTLNYKYIPPQRTRVVSKSKVLYSSQDFNILPPLAVSLASTHAYEFDDEWIQNALKVPANASNVFDVWDRIESKLSRGTDIYFYTEAADRSAALWRLTSELFRAGCTPEEVYLIAYHSKNNKFRDLRYNAERELAKDVMRAKQEIDNGPAGVKERVNDTRNRMNQPMAMRRQAIADIARNQMLSHGRFIHARGGTFWYILHNDGRPISISKASTQLNVVLGNMFGLISTEAEHNYVVAHLINHVASMTPIGEVSALSHYIPESNTLLLHTGTATVLRISPEGIDTVTNGYKDVVFLWNEEATFVPNLDNPMPATQHEDWAHFLLADALAYVAIDTITPEQAIALMKTWLLTVLLRNMITSRPILAIFGQPGAGKSTLFRRIFALLYGKHKAVSGITTPEDFDIQLSSDPILVLDNVDTWEKWLPDRIARAAATSEIKKRKLYTDTDTVTMRSQALLGLTAHNPKFGREDVTDRLILITLERFNKFRSEDEILARIREMRDRMWGAIVNDIRLILQEPPPPADTIPQFRVEDFAALGQRIANALGYPTQFHTAITSIVRQQKGFVLDEDSMLVELLEKHVKAQARRGKQVDYQTPAQLWAALDILSQNSRDFGRQYGNSIKLGKKLLAMTDALRHRFVVDFKFDTTRKLRVWRFELKNETESENNNGTET